MKRFFRNEQGQDLIEYVLLIGCLALASAALFMGTGNSVQGLWGSAGSQLEVANGGSPSTDGSGNQGDGHDHGGGDHGGGNQGGGDHGGGFGGGFGGH